MESKDPNRSLLLTEDSIGSRTKRISAVEALPTEIVQQIAEDLVIVRPDYTCTQLIIQFISPAGISQLRACSKILQAKAERTFVRCLRLVVVNFDGPGLARLVNLSLSKTYAPLVKTLVFQPATNRRKTANTNTAMPEAGGDKMDTFRHYITEHAPETTYIIFALARMRAVKSVIIGPSIQYLYPASVRQRSLARHPPSMILAATVASRAPLKHIVMWDPVMMPTHGVKPRIMDNLKFHAGCFKHLTTVRLLLTSRNLGPYPKNGLYRFLSAATQLEVLDLTLDEASMVGSFPSVFAPSKCLWFQLSSLRFGVLRALTLYGWEMGETDLALFLSTHKYTLMDVSFANCDLHGQWREILGYICNFQGLYQLELHHVSEQFYFVRFPRVGTPFVSPEPAAGDWSMVKRNSLRFEINVWDPWRRLVKSARDDVMRSSVRIRD